MASPPEPSIYDKVVRVTHVYLGPATERFIDRQIENHLHKAPTALTQDDLLSLIDWISAVVSLLTDDHGIVEEYVDELCKLAGKPSRPNKNNGAANA